MPPSLARRRHPGRELRAEGHRRGRSLEGGLLDKDDDLMLFKEMQTRERDNFLLQSDDDFDYSLSTKLAHFSDPKLGVAIPGKGQNSELLVVKGEKNDYEWLLTPPDTPLFRSLDDEKLPVSVPRRGRPRSQPISVSRSSMMERSYRSSRGSASPSRSIKSPKSSSSISQSRGRPSSAHHASPTRSQRHTTHPNRVSPSNRASPSLSKPSTPGTRSSTPTSRRMSNSSGAALGSLVKGASPVKTSRGRSASPNIRPKEANIPGFSTDTPNLCTSVANRPASYVKGTSPASMHSWDSSSYVGRRSLSPTASKCITSYSQACDRVSSHSKGSVGSSCDDDVDTLQSAYVGSLDRSTLRKVGASPSKKPFSTSKKRVVSLTSAPKRSFDLALRQMDSRKSPTNMFRPLLSSIPGSTFYAGNPGSVQNSIISRNSRVMTNNNSSCGHGIGVSLDTEEREEHRGDLASETLEIYSCMEPEIFEFDDKDLESEHNMKNRLFDARADEFRDEPILENGRADDDATCYIHSHMLVEMTAMSEASCGAVEHREILNIDNLVACSICGREYDVSFYLESDGEICPECSREGQALDVAVSDSGHDLTEVVVARSGGISEGNVHLDQFKSLTASSDSQGYTRTYEQTIFPEESCKLQVASSLENYLMDACKNEMDEEQIPPTMSESEQLDAMSMKQMLPQLNEFARVDAVEATGISVSLTRSSSLKGPLVQGRTVLSAIPSDDLSYARDSTNSLWSSYGLESASGSSSVDLGHPHPRCLKSNMGSQKYDRRSQSMGSSFSGASENAQRCFGVLAVELGDFGNSVDNGDDNAIEGTVPSLEKVYHMESNLNNQMLAGNVTQSLVYTGRTRLDDDVVVHGGVRDSDMHDDASYQLGQIIEARNHLDCSLYDKGDTGLPDTERTAFVPEFNSSYPSHDVLEESTVMVETQAGSKARSVTLEEATDTILFCRSIVHDLSYKAATVAIEKEDVVALEGSHPTVTIMGKSTSDTKDPPHRGRIVSKHALKAQKPRCRQVKKERRPPTFNAENDENIDESLTHNIGQPLKLESKCNCTIM
ncbi:hypothetical protein MLD38_006122 [Melastoma candidum]|uniref:Uncharacterized protein n=1 Tax=Melastoma candidum TaxID=119954 RepID=A0ACB9RPX7_9MYRT|nr:hypothetical protein MLD38_006122 [Melastoma candidum]